MAGSRRQDIITHLAIMRSISLRDGGMDGEEAAAQAQASLCEFKRMTIAQLEPVFAEERAAFEADKGYYSKRIQKLDLNLYSIKRERKFDSRLDEYYGFVIAAENEKFCRNVAAQESSDEGEEAWLDPKQSKVALIGKADESITQPCVLMEDYSAG